MKMSELILAVGDENVIFQNLLNDTQSIYKTKHGTKITFYTGAIQAEELMDGGKPKNMGLVLWLPKSRVDAVVAAEKVKKLNEIHNRDAGRVVSEIIKPTLDAGGEMTPPDTSTAAVKALIAELRDIEGRPPLASDAADLLAALLPEADLTCARKEIARLRAENAWRPIESAPEDGQQILVGFMGQFEWLSFIANAFGNRTFKPNFAKPTHWRPLPSPPEGVRDA